MGEPLTDRIGRAVRGTAAVALLAAAVPLAVWAVPSLHPPPAVRVEWSGHDADWAQHVVRSGFDRHGLVWQERSRLWFAPTPAARADVQRLRDGNVLDLPPTQSHWLQWSWYGNDHEFGDDGRETVESGAVYTLPYSLVAVVLATPATALWLARLAGGLARRVFSGAVEHPAGKPAG